MSAGVQLRSHAQGIVPIYEEQQARLERNISLEVWMNMDEIEKALVIAARRIRIAIDNLQSEAEIENSEKEARRRGRK